MKGNRKGICYQKKPAPAGTRNHGGFFKKGEKNFENLNFNYIFIKKEIMRNSNNNSRTGQKNSRANSQNYLSRFDSVTVGRSRFAQELYDELTTNGTSIIRDLGAEVEAETDCIFIKYQGIRVDFPFCQYQEWDHQDHVSILNFGKLAEHLENWINNTKIYG